MGNYDAFPLNLLPILAIPLIVVLAFVFSKTGREILMRIPPEHIVRLQVFRFFVELLLWGLFLENQAPVQMTFEGTGISLAASQLRSWPSSWQKEKSPKPVWRYGTFYAWGY
jgi:hypothetical protein